MNNEPAGGPAARAVALGLLLMVWHASGISQTEDYQTSGRSVDDLKRGLQVPGAIVQPQATAFESVVNPNNYLVGPSDVLAVNIWVTPPLNYSLTVTPEATVMIPTVGEVAVDDLTLAQAKRKVIDAVLTKYRGGVVTVTLVAPRPVIVMVSGNVLYPGLYTLTAVDRAHRAVEKANKTDKPVLEQGFRELNELLSTMSTRNIFLKHRDGTMSRVDVSKFLATREDRWNPFLREGDMVIVPRKSETRNLVGIYGEVNAPGRYEFVPGDSLRDLLLISFGFTRHARADSVMFYRLSPDGNRMEMRWLDARGILEGSVADVPLESGDRIVIQPIRDLRQDYRVTLTGEVLFPGTYPITRDSTRLLDALERAGGVTPNALLSGAFLTRARRYQRGAMRDSALVLRGRGAETEDDNYYLNEAHLVVFREAVNTDFEKLVRHGDLSQNVLLADGDSIHVPARTGTVYVYGQVLRPGHQVYVASWGFKDYVDQAGGYLDNAMESDVKIVKAATKQWVSPDKTTIEEGDNIWVPREPDRPFGYYLGIVAQAAAILSVAVSTVILAITIGK